MSGSDDQDKLLKMAQAVKDSGDQQLEILTEWSRTRDKDKDKEKKKRAAIAKLYFKELAKGTKLQAQLNKAAKDMEDEEDG